MYLEPLKSVKRKIADNVLIASTPFELPTFGQFGARMTIFQFGDEIIVWSAFPYGEETEKCLKQLTGKDNVDVAYLIVPNIHHTLAVKSFKQQYPNIKIVGSEAVEKEVGVEIDVKLTDEFSNKVLDKEALKKLGVSSSNFLDNLELVYLSKHRNKEVVVYSPSLKTIWSADLIIDLGLPTVPLEQYSPETGWPADKNPNSGHMNVAVPPYRQMVNKINNTDDEEAKIGIKTVYGLDFHTLVPCHGNVNTAPKETFEGYFEFCKSRSSAI